MTKISLQNAFNSYFHDKYSFDDFLNVDISIQYKNIFHSKNTFSPEVELKKYQQFLNVFIFDLMNVNTDVVFSYRKEVSNFDAVFPHKNSKYIFSTDIKSFFLNIDKDMVKQLIIHNKENFLIQEKEIEKYIDNLVNLVTYNGILPIGAPTSPKISNAYLLEFDNLIQSYCYKHNIIYTRYSDDFIFSSEDKNVFHDLLTKIKEVFKLVGFKNFVLNKEKTRMQIKGSKRVLLGLSITPNGHITVNKNMKKNIEILFHFYLTDKVKYKDFLLKTYVPRNDRSTELDKVSGVLNYIKSVDKKFITRLKNKYGSYLVNSFIDRSIDE